MAIWVLVTAIVFSGENFGLEKALGSKAGCWKKAGEIRAWEGKPFDYELEQHEIWLCLCSIYFLVSFFFFFFSVLIFFFSFPVVLAWANYWALHLPSNWKGGGYQWVLLMFFSFWFGRPWFIQMIDLLGNLCIVFTESRLN